MNADFFEKDRSISVLSLGVFKGGKLNGLKVHGPQTVKRQQRSANKLRIRFDGRFRPSICVTSEVNTVSDLMGGGMKLCGAAVLLPFPRCDCLHGCR